MSDFIKGVQVGSEVKKYDYDALGNKPTLLEVDTTLSKGGKAADAKVVGTKFGEVEQRVNQKVNTVVDSSANALKGTASGASVRVDDVSPVEHTPVVKVYGKNMMRDAELVTHPEYTELYSSALAVFDYRVEAGKTYTLSFDTENTGKRMYLNPNSGFTYTQFTMDGQRHSFTKKMTDTVINFEHQLALVSLSETTDVMCGVISNVQLEEGDTATEYEPWTDPSTTTLTYGGQTYKPNEAGSVSGLRSTSPTMVMSVPDGFNIFLEYNQDTNAAIKKLTDAIIALGGTV